MTQHQYHLAKVSGNAKTGPIPVSTTSRDSCPASCGMRGACYAMCGPLAMHWRKLDDRTRGCDLSEFVNQIKSLPEGQLWRCNQAGDLPGANDQIDPIAFGQIVTANHGKRGFTYTHYPMNADNAAQIKLANDNGFTVNLSADNLEHADRLASLGIGPVAVVLPSSAAEGPKVIKTPAGRNVLICPAARSDNFTCANCGLCAVATRKTIVGLPAHGTKVKTANQIANGGK